jgi:hypothetical protein
MTPREQALILRLAACELTREERSIIVLRRILRDLGWTDAAVTYSPLKREVCASQELPMTQDTLAGVDTIGRVTPAYYGFGGPPGRDGSSTSCKPGGLPRAMPILVC